MNALDQAFIKAFAKDRAAEGGDPRTATTSSTVQPPAADFESMTLALHEPAPQGRRLRVDRPTSADASFLSAHLIMPIVEQVQSYQPADIATSTLAQVVVEDRLQLLEESLRRAQAASNALAAPGASDTTVTRGSRGPRAKDPTAAAVQPFVLLAAAALYRPDLQHRQLACLLCRNDWRVRAALTAVEMGHRNLDPDLFVSLTTAGELPGDTVAVERAVPTETAADDFSDELAATMSAAGDMDQVFLPVSDESLSVPCGLSEEEEALLLGTDPPRELEAFAPAWEVDAFRWPALGRELDEASGRKLRQSGDELCTAVQDGLKVIAVTSTERREGRTTVALALARNAATAGCRVALVDADGGNPDLARQLGLDSPCDWRQTRRRGQPLQEAAVASLGDRVTLFPLTVGNDSLSGRLDDPVLTDVLHELKSAFDLIVIDAPPVTAGDMYVAGAPSACEVDMVLVVRNVQATRPDACLSSVARLRALGVRAVGIVENFTLAHAVAV
jgi:Mrp family chromosome partitioning ATPase